MSRHGIPGIFIVAFCAAVATACSGGGGGSTTVLPGSASAGTGAPAVSGSSTSGTQMMQLHVLLDAPANTSSKARAPQYINPSADLVVVTTYNGSTTGSPQTISLGTPASYDPAFIATSTTPCEYFHISGPKVRSCTLNVSVSPGTLTFYVVLFCGHGCNGDEPSDNSEAFAVGAGVASATVPGTSSVSVPMSPLIVSSNTTLAIASPPSNIQLAGCSGPCSEAVVFDGDDPTVTGTTSLGALTLTAYDGFSAVPAMKIDPVISNWTAGFTTGTGYNGTPPTTPNTDNFIVTFPTPPATSVSPVPITIGAFGQQTTDTTQHVLIMSNSSCSSSFSTTLSNAYVLSSAAPYVCYDNSATFNGDAAQYYSIVSAIGGSPIVPCGGSNPTCPPILTEFYYVPMFAYQPTSASSACSITNGASCIQVAQYGYTSGYFQATLGSSPYSSGSGCDSVFTVTGYTPSGSTYTGSGFTQLGSSASAGASVTSGIDSNGYAQFALSASAGGSCVIQFQFTSNGTPGQGPLSGPILSRTYTAGAGGATINTVFGRSRQPQSRR